MLKKTWLIFSTPQILETDVRTLVYMLVSVQIETFNCTGRIKDVRK